MSNVKNRISYIEPILFIIIMGGNLQGFTRQALIYQKSCKILYEECSFLQSKNASNLIDINKRINVQKLSDNVLTINSALMVVCPIIATLMSGIQIDKGRYKQSLSIPILGSSVGCLFLMFTVSFGLSFDSIYVSTVVSFIFGSVVVLTQTSFSYITVTADPARISNRLVIAEVVIIAAVSITNSIAGYLADLEQIDLSFLISLILYVISAFFGLWVIPDIFPHSLTEISPDEKKNVFKELFGVILKKGPNRKLILLYLLCYFTAMLSYNSYSSLSYLYLISDPFVMSNKQYAVVITISATGGLLFGLFSSLFLLGNNKAGNRRLEDSSYCCLACVSNITGYILLGLAKESFLTYIAAGFLSVQTIPAAILRSMLVKLVDKDEKGRLFSIIMLTQSLSAVVGNTFGLQVYRLTIETFPGLVFFILSGLAVFVLVVMICRWIAERQSVKNFSSFDIF